MSARHAVSAAVAVLLLAGALSLAPRTAEARSRICQGVAAAGHFYPVRIVRGDIHCPRARRILRGAIADARWPSGWHCLYGHGNDVWAVQCLTTSRARPLLWIRAANPTS